MLELKIEEELNLKMQFNYVYYKLFAIFLKFFTLNEVLQRIILKLIFNWFS